MAVVVGGGVLLRAPSTSAAVPALEPRTRRRRAPSSIRCRSVHGAATMAGWPAGVGGGGRVAEAEDQDHYRTLRLAPGATRGEVKEAFRRLALRYHPDVRTPGSDADGGGLDFQRINAAYQVVMRGMRAADERLEYWRLRYGLADEDLDRYRRYLNNDDDDDWFDL